MNDLTTIQPAQGEQQFDLAQGALTTIDDGVETRQLGLVVRPKTATLLARIGDDLQEAKDMAVDSAFMAEQAQVMIGRFGTVIDAMNEERLATTKPLRDAADWVNSGFNAAIDAAKDVRETLRDRVKAWNRIEQERIAAEQRKLEEARRAAAAAAAAREAEALAKARESAAAASKAMAEGSNTVAQALLVDAQVQADTAQQEAAQAAQLLQTPVVAPTTASVKGIRVTYKGRVKDKEAALREIVRRLEAGDPSLVGLVSFNETALNAYCNAAQGKINVPGLEAYPVESLRTKKQAV